MKQLLTALVSNSILANVLLITIVALGLLSVTRMVREELPELNFDTIVVVVSYPGADPEEVEEGISRRIEAVVDGLPGVKQYHTTSEEGVAYAIIEVAEGYDVNEMKDRVSEAVDSITVWPANAEKPRTHIAKEEEEVIDVVLWGSLPERQLKEWAETIRSELQRHPKVSLVEINDTREYEINIEISKQRLLQYGLTLPDVSRAIRSGSLSLSSGSIKTAGEEIRLRAIDRRHSGPELASIIVKASPGGERITLDRIATIRDGFTDNEAHATLNGQPCVLLWVEKAVGEDAITIARAVREFVAEKQKSLPEGLHITACFDDSEFIAGQISLLVRNGLMGLALVILILWFFLNTRLSFWVSMGIPISISGALILMWFLGSSINQVTLISFIIVLGIIVDDAIVVGEAIYFQRQRGKPPLEAAVDGVREVGLPVLGAVTTTMVAFMPLGFIPGVMGQVIASVPVVVVSALVISLVECLFLLPAHLNHLPDPNLPPPPTSALRQRLRRWRNAGGNALRWMAETVYPPLVDTAIRHRYVSLCIAAAILMIVAGVFAGKHIRVVFWPPIDGNSLRAYVEFPDGTPSEVTRDAIEQTREAVQRLAARTETKTGEPLIRNLYTRVFQDEPHMGRIYVEIVNPSKRTVDSQDLAAAWEEETGIIPGALRQSFREDSINVGGRADMEIWLQSKDIADLVDAAGQLKTELNTYDGVYQVSDTFRPGKTELQVRLKEEAHALGLTLEDVSRHLHAGYYGEEAFRFQRGRDDVRVRVRYPEDERKALGELDQIRIPTPKGGEVPFLSVADVEFTQGYSTISGSNGLRRIVVWGNVDAKRSAAHEVLGDLSESYLDTLVAGYPSMSWSIRGAAESNAQTVGGLKRGFAIAILGIFVIMATVFRSYVQPFLILLIVPFGIVGALVGHLVMGIPLTFLSMFGIVALTGIVVNDAIVLITCINRLVAEGMPFQEALRKGGERRFRAIFLTTASTVGGLTPLLLEKDLQAQLVIPMAASLAFGVIFATVLTLLLLPCLLAVYDDVRRGLQSLSLRRRPTPEEAPAPAVRH